MSGGCQLLQQALPPHLALITAGGYALTERLSDAQTISGPIGLPEGSFLVDFVTSYACFSNFSRTWVGVALLTSRHSILQSNSLLECLLVNGIHCWTSTLPALQWILYE